ncbi:MAG: hypothetical protein ACFFDF_00470 [Candidatus Odinarchaeota archaeon]
MDKEIKKIFKDYNKSVSKIQKLNRELNLIVNGGKFDGLYDTLKASETSEKVKTSASSDLTAQQVIRICSNKVEKELTEYSMYLADRINYFIDLRKNMDRYFGQLNISEMEFVELYYLNNKRLDWIPQLMYCSARSMYNYKKSAEKKFKKMFAVNCSKHVV